MATGTIKINQCVQTEGSSSKKLVRSSKDDEGLFDEFISSLLQKVSNNTHIEDYNASSDKAISELLEGIASTTVKPSGLSDFILHKDAIEALAEKGQVKADSFTENMLPLMNDAGILDNEVSPAFNDFSEYALKVLKDLQQNKTHADVEIQNLSDSMQYDTNENDLEALKSLLKQYGIIEDDAQNTAEIRDFSQIEENEASNFEIDSVVNTMNIINDNRSPGEENTYESNEQNQLYDLISDRSQDITDEKSSAMFVVPEKSIEAADISGQTLNPTEPPGGLPKTSELSQENIDRIAKGFRTLRLPDSTEIRVKLTPKELGEVNIRVVLEKGHVTGHITAESREVALMIENKLDLLKQEMVYKNVNLSDISVSVFTGQSDGNSRQSSRDFLNKHGGRTQNHQGFIEETDIINDNGQDTGLNIIA